MSYTIRGKQVRESTGTTDNEEAARILASRVAAAREPDRRIVGTLLDDLITDYRVNGKSHLWCEMTVRKYLQPTFGNRRAEGITKQDIADYRRRMIEDGYGNATINRCVALLRRAFRLADVAFPRIEALRENNVRTGFVDEDQFWKLYEKLPKHQQPVALVAYETGARKKVLLRLKWNQVDLKARIVRLNPAETKNKDGRMFSYSDQMAEWFEVLPRVSGYVFTYRQKPLRSIRTGWDKAVAAVFWAKQHKGQEDQSYGGYALPRSPKIGCEEYGPSRCAGTCSNGDIWTQNEIHLRPIQHRQRSGYP